MPISAVDTISLAFQHTKQQLFQPFRLSQWIKLAIVGLLAGEVGSSGGCNSSSFRFPHQGASRHLVAQSFPNMDPMLLASMIGVLVVAGLLLGIILMYVSSVMRFILFDSVVAKNCEVRRGWSRRQGPGWRFFLWKIVYTLITFAGLVVLVGIPAAFALAVGWLQAPKEHLAPLILGGIFLFFAVLIFTVGLAVVYVLTKDFVVPQMAIEGIGAFEGWRRLWPMIKAEKGGYAGYLGMKIVMAIGAGILVGIVTLILGLIIAIPTVGLSIIAVITGKSAGLTWNVYTITVAVVVGAVLLAILLFLVALISVPVVIFFPAYSIYFFAARYPTLGALIYPPVAPVLQPPVVPAPLPPAPQSAL
ncbi:MAG TPA: hypothetical protein VI386_00800 [Candidatus Sulfotelmatobacter sp.]